MILIIGCCDPSGLVQEARLCKSFGYYVGLFGHVPIVSSVV